MTRSINHIVILMLALVLWRFSYLEVLQQYQTRNLQKQSDLEVLYLPKGPALEAMSFGYRNVFANYIWFNTINYFGKHYHSDQQYQWLDHMCNLVIDLNSGEKQVYEFCALMLAWESSLPERAIAILSRAIERFPQSWRYWYLRGFNYMFFLKDDQRAQADFVKASTLPGADPFVVKLATKKMAVNQSPQAAAEFLRDLLRQSHDPVERSALEKRLKEAQVEIDIQTLEQGLKIFQQRQGDLPKDLSELVQSGIVKSDLKDPFGGKYFLDPADGQVKSTSNVRRLVPQRSKAATSFHGRNGLWP